MTPSPTVSASAPPAPPAAPAAQPPAQPAAQPPVDVSAYQRQIDELKQQVANSNRTAEYWAEKARGADKPAAPPVEEEPDVLEAITTKGAKGFDELAAKRGFVRKDEVQSMIGERATAMAKEQELMTQYPDLKRKDSEFFKATAVQYGELVKNGVPQTQAMELAAQRAELEFIRSGKIKLGGSEPTAEEKEQERLRRVRAQAGGEGRRPAAQPDEDDEELTPEQKHIADAMGISHEAYAKRAKAGVSMSVKGSR